MSATVLGIDIGGTGSRVALAGFDTADLATAGFDTADGAVAPPATLTGPGVSIGADGTSAPILIRRLISAAKEAWPDRFESLVGIGIGATGIASLSADVSELAHNVAAEADATTAVAIDAVTAHLGALSGSGGAVTVLGTGAIAIAHPGPDRQGVLAPNWNRVDGWGHLFGDRGGGAWLGRHALEAALKCHDGIDDHGSDLLAAARRRFGEPESWPAQFYTRNDRAGLLAEFAIDVAEIARTGSPAAAELLAASGREAAHSAIAAGLRAGGDPLQVVLTGGLRRAGEVLTEAFAAEVEQLSPSTTVAEPAGGPLDGALILARLTANGQAREQTGVLWT